MVSNPLIPTVTMASASFRDLPGAPWNAQEGASPLPMGFGGGEGSIRHGTTECGVTYYARCNRKPKSRVALSLVVRVGSCLEEEHERGVAHIVEHLAFRATKRYSNHDIVKFLESIGAEFGACQNAYTSLDETCYELLVPIDEEGLLDEAIQVMAEFAMHIRCSQEDVEKERGAVLEEWRQGRDASGRIAEAHWKLVMGQSRYAERLPIGLEQIIRHVDSETVGNFYRKWYQPQNIALIAVGDFDDIDHVVRLIRSSFNIFPNLMHPAPSVPKFGFEPHQLPRFKAFVDKEATASRVYVNFSRSSMDLKSANDFRELLKIDLFEHVLNSRFFKISRKRNPPFYNATSSTDRPVNPMDNFVVAAACPEGRVDIALESLLLELARIRMHGISDRELKIAKSKIMAEAESTYIEREQSQSEDVRDEFKRHFLRGEFVVTPEYEARLVKTLLKTINCDEVAELSHRFCVTDNCVVKSIEHRMTTDEDKLASVVARVVELEQEGVLEPWKEEDIPENLIASLPEPGSVVYRNEHPKLGVVELELSNGMKVMLKQTDFLDDQVLVSGFAWKGLSDVPQEHFRDASLGRDLALELGVFGLSPSVLSEIIADKRVDVGVSVGAYRRAFGGDQSPDDLEVALQLIHLLFVTEVQPDDEELVAVKQLIRESIVARLRDPMQVFSNRINERNYGCYYFRPISLKEFNHIDTHMACAFFNNFFRNPSEFVVVMTGKIQEQAVVPLLQNYLASIPRDQSLSPTSPEALSPLDFSFPKKSIREKIKLPMIEPCAVVQITFPCSVPKKQATLLGLMCKLVETRLIQLLRFNHGHVYNVSVSNFFGADLPIKRDYVVGDIAISFTCDPSLAGMLPDMVLAEIQKMQTQGVAEKEVATVLEIEKRVNEEAMQGNSYWLEQVLYCCRAQEYRQEGNMDDAFARKESERAMILAACKEDPCGEMHRALNTFLPNPPKARCTIYTLLPKEGVIKKTIDFALSLRRKLLSWDGPVEDRVWTNLLWAGGAVSLAAALAVVAVRIYKR